MHGGWVRLGACTNGRSGQGRALRLDQARGVHEWWIRPGAYAWRGDQARVSDGQRYGRDQGHRGLRCGEGRGKGV